MKILIVDQFSDLGGAQRVLLELLPALQREGWTVVVAVPGRGPLRTGAEALGIRCEEITCGPFACGTKTYSDLLRFGTQFLKLRSELRRLVDDFSPDVLYVNAPRLVPAACSLGDHAPPILFHVHSYLNQPYIARITGEFLRRARASIIANCNFVLNPLLPYLRDAPVEVIYNGVRDCPGSGEVPRQPPHTGRIGMIGRISPEKGQRVFVEAIRLLHPYVPQARFTVCGGTQFSDARAQSYFRELQELATRVPVEFTGWRDDVGEVLRGLSLLVVPSMPMAEATTRVIPEAYGCGVPVLASDLPGIREILTDGKTGFLFQPGNPGALANRIREIMAAPPEHIAAVAANARRAFEERFSIDLYHRRMIGSFNRVGAKALA
jgi:glycosyltransferase involved in cell wall biosynthesis